MILHARPVGKVAAEAMNMSAAATAAAVVQRTPAAKSVTPPRVLQSAHSPAQLCFFFKRG